MRKRVGGGTDSRDFVQLPLDGEAERVQVCKKRREWGRKDEAKAYRDR
jgi:hypothetical protein